MPVEFAFLSIAAEILDMLSPLRGLFGGVANLAGSTGAHGII